MEFSLDESETTKKFPPPPKEGKPSKGMKSALKAYQNGNRAEAAVLFQRVIDGKTKDDAGNKQRAEFYLGKSLYHLKFYQTTLQVFDSILARGPSHRYGDKTLKWMSELATLLPYPAGVIDKVGKYGITVVGKLNNAQNRSLYNHLLYLIGRAKYEKGLFDDALKILAKVPTDSKHYVSSKFFEGITHVRRRKAKPAVGAFRKIITAVDKGGAKGLKREETSRILNLARISLARLYYSAANKLDRKTGEQVVDPRVLGNAVAMWDSVDKSSEYWLDALFEESWAFFLSDEYSRSLGNVHTLYSPYFDKSYYPEALFMKAVTFFVNCQWSNAEATIEDFHRRYDPVQTELRRLLDKNTDNMKFFAFLKSVANDTAKLPKNVKPVVSKGFSDRTLFRHVQYVDLLNEEEKRFMAAPKAFQNSVIGGRVLQDVAVAKTYAVDAAGDLARARYERLIRELQDLMNQVDAVELELATAQRDQIGRELQEQMTLAAESKGGDVEVDAEHQIWPFRGEYWRDELEFYRQQVSNRCAR